MYFVRVKILIISILFTTQAACLRMGGAPLGEIIEPTGTTVPTGSGGTSSATPAPTPSALYISNKFGLLKSTDGGTNWSFLGSPGNPPYVGSWRKISKDGNNVAVLTYFSNSISSYHTLMLSADSGSTWSAYEA